MARRFTSFKKPDPSLYRGWTFVLILGGVLALLAMISDGGTTAVSGAPATTSTVCQVEVTIDNLNVRPTASLDKPPVETLRRGTKVYATRTVTNGYRELRPGYWALDQHLAQVAGSPCG